MALSPSEEQALAELEAQFTGGPGTGPNWAPLGAPAGFLLGGLALLFAGQHDALLISASDLLGFATDAITATLRLAGYAVLLGGAFLLGHRARDVRPSSTRHVETRRPVSPAARR